MTPFDYVSFLGVMALALVVGLGFWLMHTAPIKLVRAIRLENRGNRLLWEGYREKAESLLTRSLRMAEEAVGPDAADVGVIAANLAMVHRHKEDFDEAERLYRRAIAIRENAIGPEDRFVSTILQNLAEMYRSQGRDAEAAQLDARSQVIEETTSDPPHILAMSGVITNSGLIPKPPGWEEHMEAAYAAENMDEAEIHIREAIIDAELSGLDSPYLGESLHELGWLCIQKNDFEEAETHILRSISIREAAFGDKYLKLAGSLNNLAEVYRAQERPAEAEPLFQRALAIREKEFGPEHPEIAADLNNLASLYEQQGRLDEAEELCLRVLAMEEALLDMGHPRLAMFLGNIASLYATQGRFSDAEAVVERALEILDRNPGAGPLESACTIHLLAFTRLNQGKFDESLPKFSRSVQLFECVVGSKHPQLVSPLLNYAFALWNADNGNEFEAEEMIKRSLAIAEAHFGSDHPKIATILVHMAELYDHQGRFEDVELLQKRSSAIGRLQ